MLKKLSNIPKDKLLHFFWGTILSFILILYCGIVGMIIALIIPAIKELYYDGGKRDALGKKARIFSVNNFSIEVLKPRYIEYYQSLLN